MGNQQSSNSLPVQQETADSEKRNSLIAREFDVGKELEHDEMQPEKRQRKLDEQSMVIYGHEQASSNSNLTCHLDWLANDSAMYPKIMTLKNELEHLFARQCDVLTELKHAEIQPGQKRREEVSYWLSEVQRKKDKIRSIIKDGEATYSNFKLSGFIESFIKEVVELNQIGKFPNGLVLLDQESTRFPLLLGIKPVGIDFQHNAEKIIGWLQNHEHCIIGVYGMGGVGKTTLLTHIHNQLLQDSNLFGHVYWVTVSQNCSIRKLQEDIAKVLGLASFREDDERKRAAVLHNRLAERGRIVLVLDDMWEQVSGSKVGIPLENSDCKIILSTRLYDVCRKMGCKDFVIKANILQEGEAWDLFVEKLGHYDTLEEEAKKLAWDIAKECSGLPLAIATMARSMTGVVSINEWKSALNELRSARGQVDMEEDVIPILQYSYDRLNDKRVQNCFLSCILYHEDERISRRTLIDLWITEGLLDEIESQDAQIAKGHVILNKLEGGCLLESVFGYEKEKCVKMHDLIRDMAMNITHPFFMAEAGKLKQVPSEEKWNKDLVKVSLSHNIFHEIPSALSPMTPNLTVLMMGYNFFLNRIPDSFFLHMNALTILDLSETSIERVPESVSDLENLRGLLLVDCKNLIYVPSVAKLTNLRKLDLEGCYSLKEAPKGLERLKNVEKVSYIPWDVTDMVGFNKVIQSLTSLSCFRIWIRDPTFLELIDDNGEFRYGYEIYDKMMRVTGGEFGGSKSSIMVPATLEYLVIHESEMKGSSLGDVFASLGEATGLKDIKIKGSRGLEYVSGLSGTQQGHPSLCPQLESLHLILLPDLKGIAKLGTSDSFSHLRELTIRGCPKMKVVLPVTCTKQLHLPELERIEVSDCEEVEEIYESNAATLLNPSPSLPKLKELSLIRLPKMKVIFPFADDFHLPDLETIRVRECEQVKDIFEPNKATPYNPVLSLPVLKNLILSDLPQLGSIYRGLLLCTSLVNPTQFIKFCPKLKLWILPGGVTSDEPRSTMNSKQESLLTDHININNQPA